MLSKSDDFVKPFIQNKIEKTFVDYFFLRDQQQLLKHASSEMFNNLNAMEKVLLILFLKEIKEEEQAKELASYMEMQNKLKKYDNRTFKRYFDTVLNSKTEGMDKEALKKNLISNQPNNE